MTWGKNEKYIDSISNITISVCKAYNSELFTTEHSTLHPVWSQVQVPTILGKYVLALTSLWSPLS